MKGSLTHEVEVMLPASEVWEVYSTLRLAQLVTELLPHVVAKAEILEGDGGVGTVVRVTFPTGSRHTEKFVRVDDEERIKDVEVIEGGFLELGFTFFHVRFQIVEKKFSETCIIRTVLEYEVGDQVAGNASFVSTAPFEAIAEGISKYLMEKKGNQGTVEGDNQTIHSGTS